MMIAVLPLVFATLAASQAATSTQFPPRSRHPTVEADLIAYPSGIGGEDFAAQLAGREGLSSWNGTGSAMPAGDGLEAIAVYGGNGRRVMVLYRPGPAGRRGVACRLRIAGTAKQDDWNAARDWCVERLSASRSRSPDPQ